MTAPVQPARVAVLPLVAVALLVLGLLLLPPVAVAARATPASGQPGPCPDSRGVTVVIDFQELGGGVVVRCAPGPTGSGLDALRDAGFQVEGVRRWGDAFICRIQGLPAPGQAIPVRGDEGYTEACIDTPPAAAYWSYWHAENGQDWVYSQWGVKNRDAIPGGFEGWSFSLNATADTNPQPRFRPFREEAAPPAQPAPTESRPAPVDDPGSAGGSGAGAGPAQDGSSAAGGSDQDGSGQAAAEGSVDVFAHETDVAEAAEEATNEATADRIPDPSADPAQDQVTRTAEATTGTSTEAAAQTAAPAGAAAQTQDVAWTGELPTTEVGESGGLFGIPWSVWATVAIALALLTAATLALRRRSAAAPVPR